MKVIVAIVLVAASLGCTGIVQKAPPDSTNRGKLVSITNFSLDPLKSVFVAVPQDGEFANERYIGSGQAVAQATAAAFTKQGIPVYIGEGLLADDEALLAAKSVRAGYVVKPLITLWSQHNQWLGRLSKLGIRVSIVDVSTGRLIESRPIETSHQSLLAFNITNPETLLEKSLNNYVSRLYQ
jgi:hypothetical protein